LPPRLNKKKKTSFQRESKTNTGAGWEKKNSLLRPLWILKEKSQKKSGLYCFQNPLKQFLCLFSRIYVSVFIIIFQILIQEIEKGRSAQFISYLFLIFIMRAGPFLISRHLPTQKKKTFMRHIFKLLLRGKL